MRGRLDERVPDYYPELLIGPKAALVEALRVIRDEVCAAVDVNPALREVASRTKDWSTGVDVCVLLVERWELTD